VPEPGNLQALNRYAYVYHNPLRSIDGDGHLPVVPLLVAGAILALQVVDYGWTAYEAWHSLQVMNDPHASPEARAEAAANLALTAAFEAGEPDDLLPISLPLDDLARVGLIGGVRKIGKEIGEEAAERLGKEAGKEMAEETVETTARGGTYRLVDPTTGEVQYVGRTADLARRAAEHQRDPIKKRLMFEVDWLTDDYVVQRGREQMLYEHYRPSLNRIRPISPRNPRLQEYLDAARRFEEKMR